MFLANPRDFRENLSWFRFEIFVETDVGLVEIQIVVRKTIELNLRTISEKMSPILIPVRMFFFIKKTYSNS